MIFRNKAKAADWMTGLAIAISIIILAWVLAGLHDERFIIPVPGAGYVFWIMIFAWTICVTCAVLWRRRWWLLLTAPFLLFPVYIIGAVVVSCLQGRCF